MAFETNGNHVEPVVWFVASVVMVLVCGLVATTTRKITSTRNFATIDGVSVSLPFHGGEFFNGR